MSTNDCQYFTRLVSLCRQLWMYPTHNERPTVKVGPHTIETCTVALSSHVYLFLYTTYARNETTLKPWQSYLDTVYLVSVIENNICVLITNKTCQYLNKERKWKIICTENNFTNLVILISCQYKRPYKSICTYKISYFRCYTW